MYELFVATVLRVTSRQFRYEGSTSVHPLRRATFRGVVHQGGGFVGPFLCSVQGRQRGSPSQRWLSAWVRLPKGGHIRTLLQFCRPRNGRRYGHGQRIGSNSNFPCVYQKGVCNGPLYERGGSTVIGHHARSFLHLPRLQEGVSCRVGRQRSRTSVRLCLCQRYTSSVRRKYPSLTVRVRLVPAGKGFTRART